MKSFKEFLNESTYYHGTSKENAESILKNGIDPSKYKSGVFKGFYLTPNLNHFKWFNKQPEVMLRIEIDDDDILDADDVKDKDLDDLYVKMNKPKEDDFGYFNPSWRKFGLGYKYNLIELYAKENGYLGIRNGKEVILFSPKAVKDIKVENAI